MRGGDLPHQPRTRRRPAAELTEGSSTERQLVRERRRYGRALEHRDETPVVVDVNRLDCREQAVEDARAVEVLTRCTRQIDCHTRRRGLRAAEPERQTQRLRGVALALVSQRVRIAQHVVSAADVEPRLDPGGDCRRIAYRRLKVALPLEPRVSAEESVAIGRGDYAEW